MSTDWNPDFYQKSEIFRPILTAYQLLKIRRDSWPNLLELQNLLSSSNRPVRNSVQTPITFVSQITTNESLVKHEKQYESLIYEDGKVQTRLQSWHDFFQVLVWASFPTIKAQTNALHYLTAHNRLEKNPANKQRTDLENFLTLFDECGAIIIYSDQKLAELVKNFQWRELFIDNKMAFSNSIECMVFGHGMYEKAINPYLGMTAQCLFLQQPAEYFQLKTEQKTTIVDNAIAQMLSNGNHWTSRSLQPLPVLGIPGWHADNNKPEFYDNTQYFRPKRQRGL